MSYIAVKHIHLMFAVLSIALFYSRSFSRMGRGRLAANRVVFISSHAIDTFLLLSAVTLLFIGSINPMSQPWLMEKIVLVIGYIALGVVAARAQRRTHQWVFLALNTLVLLTIGYLAGTKHALLL